jgi:hypothetical protein
MKFDCLTKGAKFITAAPSGHGWYQSELDEFSRSVVDLSPMPFDYTVDLSGVTVLASSVSASLVEGAE